MSISMTGNMVTMYRLLTVFCVIYVLGLVEGLRCYLCTSKEDPQTCSYDQFDYGKHGNSIITTAPHDSNNGTCECTKGYFYHAIDMRTYYAHSCEPASTPLKEGCTDDGLSCACAQDLCNHGNQLVAPTFVLCYVVMLLCNGIYSF
ncbi:uncharacterized protein LOC128208227 [Mya arenaria]|uniref:uncharacterized protein LOC128208227 n=1 Tax=Mya arenaria TaxID=6604 RepID=UPI0022DECB06|nr:uncharacterized protein LOC128208227 [Mya arenaria]